VPGAGLDYELRLSPRRRTLALEVAAGKVVVRAPSGADPERVAAFVYSRWDWVEDKLQLQRLRLQEVPARTFSSGERLPYLGCDHELVVSRSTVAGMRAQHGQLLLCLPARARADVAVRRWYLQQARQILGEKTAACARRLGVSVADMTLRQTKTKWGHCTRSGRIQYNWLIILAPEAVVDYLVAHEVSHRVHLNHSPAFWQTVASLCPDYLHLRQWLKRHGHTLIL
jgi:predicted metal-dependent hydrolase